MSESIKAFARDGLKRDIELLKKQHRLRVKAGHDEKAKNLAQMIKDKQEKLDKIK